MPGAGTRPTPTDTVIGSVSVMQDSDAKCRQRTAGVCRFASEFCILHFMVNVFSRLLEFARPYWGRLATAVVAMVVYGAASVGVVRQVEPILDEVLPKREDLVRRPSWRSWCSISLKGVGAYVSGYLMTDVGQRVVRDIRDRLFRHILGQSAAFFSVNTQRPADVADYQRRGAGAARRLGDARRSRARVAGAARFRGGAVLLRRAAGDRLPDRRAAGRVSAGPPRPARPPDDARGARKRWSRCRTSAPRRSPAIASSRPSAPRSARRRSSSAHPTTTTGRA